MNASREWKRVMRKRMPKDLVPGDLVAAHDKRENTLYAAPELMGTPGSVVGRFAFGMVLSLRRGGRPGEREEEWAFVIDSRTMRYGWCLTYQVRRPRRVPARINDLKVL